MTWYDVDTIWPIIERDHPEHVACGDWEERDGFVTCACRETLFDISRVDA